MVFIFYHLLLYLTRWPQWRKNLNDRPENLSSDSVTSLEDVLLPSTSCDSPALFRPTRRQYCSHAPYKSSLQLLALLVFTFWRPNHPGSLASSRSINSPSSTFLIEKLCFSTYTMCIISPYQVPSILLDLVDPWTFWPQNHPSVSAEYKSSHEDLDTPRPVPIFDRNLVQRPDGNSSSSLWQTRLQCPVRKSCID